MSAATVTRSWSSRSWIYPPTISGSSPTIEKVAWIVLIFSQRVGEVLHKICIARQWDFLNRDLHRAESYIYMYGFPYVNTWYLPSNVAKYAQTFPKGWSSTNTATLILRWFKYFNWFCGKSRSIYHTLIISFDPSSPQKIIVFSGQWPKTCTGNVIVSEGPTRTPLPWLWPFFVVEVCFKPPKK